MPVIHSSLSPAHPAGRLSPHPPLWLPRHGGRTDTIVLCRQLLGVRNAPADQEAGGALLVKCEIPVSPIAAAPWGASMSSCEPARATIRFVVTRHD